MKQRIIHIVYKWIFLLCCLGIILNYRYIRRCFYRYYDGFPDALMKVIDYLPQIIFGVLWGVFAIQVWENIVKKIRIDMFQWVVTFLSVFVSFVCVLYVASFHRDVSLVGGGVLWLIIGVFDLLNIKPSQTIVLVNRDNLLKECSVGFSWCTFLFGGFVPLVRGDLKWTILMFLASFTVIGIFLNLFWVSANYNRLYILDLLEKGYKPFDDKAEKVLNEMGIYYA